MQRLASVETKLGLALIHGLFSRFYVRCFGCEASKAPSFPLSQRRPQYCRRFNVFLSTTKVSAKCAVSTHRSATRFCRGETRRAVAQRRRTQCCIYSLRDSRRLWQLHSETLRTQFGIEVRMPQPTRAGFVAADPAQMGRATSHFAVTGIV